MKPALALGALLLLVLPEGTQGGTPVDGVPNVPSPPGFTRETEYLLDIPADIEEGKEGEKKTKPEDEEEFQPAFLYRRDGDIWGRLEDGTKPTNLTNFAEDDDYKTKHEKAVAEENEWRKATGGRSGRTPVMLDFTYCRDDGKIYYYLGYVQRDFEFFSMNSNGAERAAASTLSLPALGPKESATDEFLTKRRDVVFAFRTANRRLAPLRVETMGIEHLRDYTLSPDAQRFARLWRQILRADTEAEDPTRRVNEGKGYYLLLASAKGDNVHSYRLLDTEKVNEELPPSGIAVQIPENPSSGNLSNTNYRAWGLYWSPDGEWVVMLGPQADRRRTGVEPGGHIVMIRADGGEARIYHRWASDETWRGKFQSEPRPTLLARTPNATRHRDEMEELPVQYLCPAVNADWQKLGYPLMPLTWSPDSKHLAFWLRRREADAWVVHFGIMCVSDGHFVRVDCAPGLSRDYAWSPDGKRIAIEVTGKQRPNRPLTPKDIEEMPSAICVAEVAALFAGGSGDLTVVPPDDERFSKIAVGYKGIGLTWIGPALEEEFVPLELVVPRGSDLSDELAGVRRRHDDAVKKLKQLSETLKGKEDNEQLLKDIRDVRVTIRFHEEDFFKTAADAIGAYAWGDFDRQSQAFRDRVVYLQRQVATWHDTLREYGYGSYVVHFSQYRREEMRFKQALKDLNHTLDLWNVYNSMVLAHHDLMAREIRIQLGVDGYAGKLDEHLAGICRRKARILLDQGERAVIQAQVNREAALYYQRSYWDGIRAEAEKRENVETLTIKEEAAAMTAFASQFMLRSIGGAWEAWLDSLKWAPGLIPVVGEYFESRADTIDRQVFDLRKETRERIKALDEMRGYVDVEFAALRDELRGLEFNEDGSPKGRLPADISLGEKALAALLTDRFFHEQTDGGLFRIAGAFDVELTDKLSTEYLAALQHARLVVSDIQAATRARMGADVTTGETSWSIILEPTRNIEIIVRGYSGEWRDRADYLGRRKGHVAQMYQMATFWRTRGYAFEAYELLPGSAAAPGEDAKPIFATIHEDLSKHSPDYVNFLIRRAILVHDFDAVGHTIEKVRGDTKEDWDRLDDLIQQRRLILRAVVQVMRTRALRLEAADRLMTWDYDGCIACMKEAFCNDPSLQAPATKDPKRPNLGKEILARRRKLAQDIETLEEALRWEKLLDSQIASFREVGQQGFMTALIGGACQGIKLPTSLAQHGGQIWKFGASIFKFTGKAAWKQFGQYALREINPFFINDVRGLLGFFRTGAQMVAAQAGSEMVLKSLESFDVDTDWLRPWVDKLAIVLVARGTRYVEEAYAPRLEQWCGDLANRIVQLRGWLMEKVYKGEVDVETQLKLDAARGRLLSWATVLKLVEELYYEARGLESEYMLMQADAAIGKGLFKSRKEYLYFKTRKLTGPAIDRAYSRYMVAALEAQRVHGREFDPDAAADLFRRMPIDDLRHFKANRDTFAKNRGMERAIDEIRCTLTDYGRRHVANKYKDYCRYIVVSGTPPNNREYRLLDSDNDYTILLRFRKDLTPEQKLTIQQEIETEYKEFFKTRHNGFDPEAYLDSNVFCDWMPSEEAVLELKQYLDEFRRNVENPERYILPDCLQFIPLYLYRKVGIMQEVQPDGSVKTLRGPDAEAVFAHVTLHESMGAQIILDQYRFNMKYYAKLTPGIGTKTISPTKYLKAQAKYNLRSLLGYNLTHKAGVLKHNEFTATDDYTLHKSIVRIAKEVWPDDPELHLLADEWFALKTGGTVEAALQARMRMHGLSDLQSAVNEHLKSGETYIGTFLERALRVQRQHMASTHKAWWEMRNAPNHAQRMESDPEYVRQFRAAEYEYWSHVCSQAYVLAHYKLEPGAVEKTVEIAPSAKEYFTASDQNVMMLSHEAADKERRDEETEKLRRLWGL